MSGILRLIAGGLLALIACYIGILIRRKYREREKFYASAAEYARYIKSELSCAKTPLPTIAERFSCGRKEEFTRVLAACMAAQRRGEKSVPIDIHILKANEREEALAFLMGQGRVDLSEQMALADRYAAEFELKRSRCEQESKKLGGMYFKLCVLLGLAIILILA